MGPTVTPKGEARRLKGLPLVQARAQFGDRVARAFLLDGVDDDAFRAQLQFNALLATACVAEGVNLWL